MGKKTGRECIKLIVVLDRTVFPVLLPSFFQDRPVSGLKWDGVVGAVGTSPTLIFILFLPIVRYQILHHLDLADRLYSLQVGTVGVLE